MYSVKKDEVYIRNAVNLTRFLVVQI